MTSWQSLLLRPLVSYFVRQTMRGDIPEMRARAERQSAQLKAPAGVRFEAVEARGVPGELVIPDGAAADSAIFYLHGGAYVLGGVNGYRVTVAHVAKPAGMRAFHVDYRLAPEHPFPAAVEDCLAAYRWLIEEGGVPPSRVVLMGESAGGGLLVSVMLAAREAGLALPAAGVAISPSYDATRSGPSHTECARTDICITRENIQMAWDAYAAGQDRTAPLLSPVFADLRGLPPLMLHAAEGELLRDDAVLLAERAREAGVDVTLKIWPGMWHAFAWMPLPIQSPEMRQAQREMVAFVHAHVGRATTKEGAIARGNR